MNGPTHDHSHAFGGLRAREREGLVVASRRGMLKASLAGLAGLSLPDLLRLRSAATAAGVRAPGARAVILLWMAGGPSQIDTWDPKPDRPLENRGPFGTVATRIPGVRICEHLPRQAAMLDKFTIIRSVDARHSNHEPNKVIQTANLDAEPRVSPSKDLYPAIGSIVAKHHGANVQGIPAYVAFQTSRTHVAHAGYLGKQYDPFIANQACKLPMVDYVGKEIGKTSPAGFFQLPDGVTQRRLGSRRALLEDLDSLRAKLEHSPDVAAMDRYGREAIDLLVGPQAREAFDLEREPQAVRDRYGKHVWHQQALLARRLVEAGAAFVTLDLSYHPASGTWDNHGDNIPPYGGIGKGLGPLLPIFDHLITTLVSDLDERGMLDDVLVIAMGEFGRTPMMGTQGSTDGRNHWNAVMSMCLAGGGMRHGQVIGATQSDGGYIKDRPVTPADLAATIYRHMGVPLDATYRDADGRDRFIVTDGGEPIAELF